MKIGPLANEKQLKNVLNYIEFGKEDGADLVYGGEPLANGEFEKDTMFSLLFLPM